MRQQVDSGGIVIDEAFGAASPERKKLLDAVVTRISPQKGAADADPRSPYFMSP